MIIEAYAFAFQKEKTRREELLKNLRPSIVEVGEHSYLEKVSAPVRLVVNGDEVYHPSKWRPKKEYLHFMNGEKGYFLDFVEEKTFIGRMENRWVRYINLNGEIKFQKIENIESASENLKEFAFSVELYHGMRGEFDSPCKKEVKIIFWGESPEEIEYVDTPKGFDVVSYKLLS